MTEADVGPVSVGNSCFELRYEGPPSLVSRRLSPHDAGQNLEVHVLDSVNAAFREIAQTWPIRCSTRDPMNVEIVSISHHQVRDAGGFTPQVETCVQLQSALGSEAECAGTDGQRFEAAGGDRRAMAVAYEGEFRRSLRIATETAIGRLMRHPRASD